MTYDISKINPKQIAEGFRARFVHTEKVTIAIVDVEAGSILPQHSHIHEQTTQVLEGKFELTIEGVTKVYENGTAVVIPPNAIHGGKALTDCKIMDVFCPVREDYK